MELMQEYADRNWQPAFAELVHRHINLVYSVALRYVANPQDAEDATQAVFVILAQKAASLRQRRTLTGWLYETTRFTAARLVRTRARRHAREQEAYMQSIMNDSETERAWGQLAPLLEEAMSRLSEKERTLVALRFFENKTGRETADLLGIEEWAAHKGASRALEKLRGFFLKRGISSTTAIIAGAISANSVHAAPVALANSVTALALAKGAVAGGSTLTLIKGILQIMAWTKANTAAVVGVAVVLAAGTATVITKTKSAPAKTPVVAGAPVARPQIQLGAVLNNPFNRVAQNAGNRARIQELRAGKWPEERRLMEHKIKARQERDETTGAVTIDLTPYTNAKLTDGPLGEEGNNANNFADVPAGVHIFGGVPFDVRGAIYLMGGWLAHYKKTYPNEVDNIRIERRCAKLHLFHGASLISFEMFGNTIAKLILHYQDGSKKEVAIVAGKQVMDFWTPLFSTGVSPANLKMDAGTEAAWTGTNPAIRRQQPDESLVLFRTTFENPQPDVILTGIDYVSSNTPSVPILFGLTVE